MIGKETLELLQKDIILETPLVDPREGLIVSSPWSPHEVLFEDEFPMNLIEEEPPERPPERPLRSTFVEYTEEPTGKYLVIHLVDISEEVLRPPRRFHPWSLRRSASLGSLSMSPTEESPVELPVESPVESYEGSFVGFSEEYSEEWSSGYSA